MNWKRIVYVVLAVLLISSVLQFSATPALAGSSKITNRIASIIILDSGCSTGTGWLRVTVITDSTPSGYNSITAHAIGTPDTFIFNVPNGVSPYTHDIRFT